MKMRLVMMMCMDNSVKPIIKGVCFGNPIHELKLVPVSNVARSALKEHDGDIRLHPRRSG